MCSIARTIIAEADRTSRNESLKDAFDENSKKTRICSRLRNLEPQQERNTSFQKRERVFFVFGNSYFTLPIRNGLRYRGRTTLHHPTSLK